MTPKPRLRRTRAARSQLSRQLSGGFLEEEARALITRRQRSTSKLRHFIGLVMAGLSAQDLAIGQAGVPPADSARKPFEIERIYLDCLQRAEGPSKDYSLLHVLQPSRSFGCLEKRSDSSRAHWTMGAMMSLGIALEAYSLECDGYPEVSDIRSLDKVLRAYFPGEPPNMDGWGTPFRYLVSADHEWFLLVSAGSDAIFEVAALPDFSLREMVDGSFGPPELVVSEDFRTDIVLEPGPNWSQVPQLYLPDGLGSGLTNTRGKVR